MPAMSPPSPEVLLILMPWDPPAWFTDALPKISPGIKIITHKCSMYDKEVPAEITQETWDSVTIFFTWNALPAKGQAPNLQYVQLLSAGCNHVIGTPLFEETDVTFCTANGVHP